jgi:hypothetical protein
MEDWMYITILMMLAGAAIALVFVNRMITRRHAQTGQPWKKGGSITTTPIDNPLDFRKSGNIHKGDPGWEIMEAAMKGKAVIGHQNPDGTWTIEPTSD